MTYEKDADYCSCSPDGFLGYTWRKCCYFHDRQYRNEVKFRKTRKEADIDLRECMKTQLPKYLHFIAWIYYLVVRSFNNKYWTIPNKKEGK